MNDFKQQLSEIINSKQSDSDKLWALTRLLKNFIDLIDDKFNKDYELKDKLSNFLENFKQEIIISEIKIPEIIIPEIEVPKVEVKVNPDIKFPEYPKEIDIKQPKWWNIEKLFNYILDNLDNNFNKILLLKDNVFNVKLKKGTPENSQYNIILDEKGNVINWNDILEKLEKILTNSTKENSFKWFNSRGIDPVGIKNVANTKINPATEEKQDTLITNTTVGTANAGNSSTTPLGIGGVFTGVAVDTKDYVTVNVVVKTSHASATDGFSLQFSPDGTNWDISENHTIVGGEGLAHLSRAKAKWFRVVYTNGGTAQTYFRLATILKNTSVSQTFERLSMDIEDNHDAAVVRAIIAGKKPDGNYVNFQSTTAGNFKVSVEETEPLSDTPEFFEDTSFVTGDSPVTLDLNTALGRNATKGSITNDGVGNFTVAFSTNGTAFGDAITMKKNETLNFENISVDSLKLTWISDSSYRIIAI